MTFAEFALESAAGPYEQRLGQYAMNLLSVTRPDIYDAIAGTSDDPYYDDELLPYFYDEVQSLW